MKGRNTTVIAVRLPDSVYTMIQRRAKEQGISVGDWVKQMLSVNAIDTNTVAHNPSVIPNIADRLRAAGLTLEGNKIVGAAKPATKQSDNIIPLYNPAIHKPGDRVLVKPAYGKRLVTVIIPDLDVDGNPIP